MSHSAMKTVAKKSSNKTKNQFPAPFLAKSYMYNNSIMDIKMEHDPTLKSYYIYNIEHASYTIDILHTVHSCRYLLFRDVMT